MMELFLLAALFTVCIYYEKKNNDRRSDDEWLYCCRNCLINIADQFRDDCHEILLIHLKKYTTIVHYKEYKIKDKMSDFSFSYRYKLDKLEDDYIKNIETKAKERLKYFHCSSLPEHLLEEYYKRIKSVSSKYRDINYNLFCNLQELESNYREIMQLME